MMSVLTRDVNSVNIYLFSTCSQKLSKKYKYKIIPILCIVCSLMELKPSTFYQGIVSN